jgi:hypothetical protein
MKADDVAGAGAIASDQFVESLTVPAYARLA